ncbi:MAG: OmpA family protein [Chlorobi bacterium]|nr:OmpA family protein [Chlorobiota bacterium]
MGLKIFTKKNITVIIFLMFSIIGFSQTAELLPEPINSENQRTIAPYVSYDGNSIVFIRQTKKFRHMFESKKQADGKWSLPVPIDSVNIYDSLDYFIDAPTYNHDATVIYFSMLHDDRRANFDIYYTKKEDGIWRTPVKMKAPINGYADETDPFISFDGKYLFFARRFEDKEFEDYECYQIYVSQKNDTAWGIPKALPNPINSGCDRAPRMAADGKTLYFMSVRGNNNTGIDLYYAKKITKNAWLTPIPIDTINNSEDEAYPSIPLSGNFLYYQIKSKKKNSKDEKVVKYPLPIGLQPEKTTHFYGYVTDLKSGKPLKAFVNIIDPNTSEILSQVTSDEKTGKYSLFLQKGKKYRIEVFNKNSSHYFFYFDARKINKFQEIQKNIQLYRNVNLILNVYDTEIYEPIPAKISIIDKKTNTKIHLPIKTLGTGRFYITLAIGKKYKIEAEQKHFKTNSFDLDLTGVVQFSEFERDLELQVKKVDYEINLSNQETGESVETVVEITNLSTNEKIIRKIKTGKNGKLKIKLRDGEQYEISVKPKGYAFYNTTVNLVDEDADYTLNAELKPLKKNTKVELHDINFESNSADLNESSYTELNQLFELLTINPQMKVEISAHTDDVGSKAYNLKLSDRRAASVKEYLTDNGIPDEQIIAKGYGESKPAYLPVNTEENRARNRRVELKIIDIKS